MSDVDALAEAIRYALLHRPHSHTTPWNDADEAIDELVALTKAALISAHEAEEVADELRRERDEAREFAAEKQTSLVHQWRERAQAAERNHKRLADKNVEIQRWADGRLEELRRHLQRYETFEDDVRDVMDFMPKDTHYHGLNSALAKLLPGEEVVPD